MRSESTVRTLLVDDDPAALALHQAFLAELAGFRVVGVAASQTEALALVHAVEADLLLLDVELPDGCGLDILNQLRATGRAALDVIMITAANDTAVVDRALLHSVADYLVKPFTRIEFQQRMVRYARERERRKLEFVTAGGAGSAGMSQREIDSKFSRSDLPERLPKGMSEQTLALVRAVFASNPAELSSAQVSEQAGISRVSARRYLAHLARGGQVRVRSQYGNAGRPEHLYRSSGK